MRSARTSDSMPFLILASRAELVEIIKEMKAVEKERGEYRKRRERCWFILARGATPSMAM